MRLLAVEDDEATICGGLPCRAPRATHEKTRRSDPDAAFLTSMAISHSALPQKNRQTLVVKNEGLSSFRNIEMPGVSICSRPLRYSGKVQSENALHADCF